MIAAHRRRHDKINRERVFINDNQPDFPAASPVDRISRAIDAKIDEALAADADLLSSLGDKAQAMEIKADWRDRLLEIFQDLVTGAAAIGNLNVPGITAKFRMPYPRTELNLIAYAEMAYADTAPLEHQFIDAGLDPGFRDGFRDARERFTEARDQAETRAAAEHAEAVAALENLWREIMEMSRQRSAMVKLKYKNNPARRAAWEMASHLDKAPQRPKNDPAA